jgi:hypothetical protein
MSAATLLWMPVYRDGVHWVGLCPICGDIHRHGAIVAGHRLGHCRARGRAEVDAAESEEEWIYAVERARAFDDAAGRGYMLRPYPSREAWLRAVESAPEVLFPSKTSDATRGRLLRSIARLVDR